MLVSINIDAKDDEEVKQLFEKHFIETGILDAGCGGFYNEIYKEVQEEDMESMVAYNEDEVNSLTGQATNLINQIEQLLSKQ